MLLIKVLVYFSFFICATCYLIRSHANRYGLFQRPFAMNTVLNITPIVALQNIADLQSCVAECVRNRMCWSINFSEKFKTCELLDRDRRASSKHDYGERMNYIHLDTASHFDACDLYPTCYPCQCSTSTDYNRQKCNCTNMEEPYNVIGWNKPKWIKLSKLDTTFYGADENSVFKTMADEHAVSNNWDTIFSESPITNLWHTPHMEIMYTLNDKCKFWKDSVIYNWRSDCTFLYLFKGSALYLDGNGALYKRDDQPPYAWYQMTISGKNLEHIQEHKGYWYSLHRPTNNLVRHPITSSTDVDRWEVYLEDDIEKFKFNFNGVLFILRKDSNVYYYDDVTDQFYLYKENCLDFDVAGTFVCIDKTTEKVISNLPEVFRPNLHIPFRHQNTSTNVSPYGRGNNGEGNGAVVLNPKEANIMIDQFGRGNVLHITTKNKFMYGSLMYSALGHPNSNSYERVFTISLWCRFTVDPFTSDKYGHLFTIGDIGTTKLYFKRHDQNRISMRVVVMISADEEVGIAVFEESFTKFTYWTNVAFSYTWGQQQIKLFINGTVRSVKTGHESRTSKMHTGSYTECLGCYVSDIAVWYAYFTETQIAKVYKEGLENPKFAYWMNGVTATSCKDLKQSNPSNTKSGFYWIILDDVRTPVWCDMDTDGGGWTCYGYLNSTVTGTIKLDDLKKDDLSQISDTHLQNVIISFDALQDLKAKIGFTQIRKTCTAEEEHDRTLDFITDPSSTDLLDYLLKNGPKPQKTCGAFYKSERDNSLLLANCDFTIDNRNYFKVLDETVTFKYGFKGKYRCDSVSDNDAGIFELFVR